MGQTLLIGVEVEGRDLSSCNQEANRDVHRERRLARPALSNTEHNHRAVHFATCEARRTPSVTPTPSDYKPNRRDVVPQSGVCLAVQHRSKSPASHRATADRGR